LEPRGLEGTAVVDELGRQHSAGAHGFAVGFSVPYTTLKRSPLRSEQLSSPEITAICGDRVGM
jgi:hypothetical protein